MPAFQKFNRSVRTKNLNSWPSDAEATKPKKISAMGFAKPPGKTISKSTGLLTYPRLNKGKMPKVPK